MKKEKNYIVCDEFDILSYQEAKEELPPINNNYTLSRDWINQIGQELYNVLYKAKPKVNEQFTGDPSIAKIVEAFRLTKEAEELRQNCRFDQRSSTMSAVQLTTRILERLSSRHNHGIDHLVTMKTHDVDIADPNNSMAAEIRVMIAEATKEAEEDVEAINIAAGLLAGSEACPLDRKDVTLQNIYRLAEEIKNNPEVKKMIEFAGQMQQSANKLQASKLSHGVDELYEVGTGNDIPRLLPSELIKLRRNKKQFYLDFIEKKLMQYKLRGGTEPLEKGPVVVCVDVSGSMYADNKFNWAKAALLTLHNICSKQRRDLHVLLFNSGIMYDRRVLKSGVVDGKGIMDLLWFSPTGGTEFEYPLTRSREVIEEYESTSKKPDIIFITDGYASLSPSWKDQFKAAKRKIGFSLFTFFIGKEGDLPDRFRESVSDISDRCTAIPTVAEANDAYSTMFSI